MSSTSRRSRARTSVELDTPVSIYLRNTYDLPLPARFYDSKTLKPIVNLTLDDVRNAVGTNPLITLYERSEGNLSIEDITLAFILQNAPSGQRKNLLPIVEVIRSYGSDLSTRFGIDNYLTYSTAQLEADRAYWQSTLKAEKDYERVLSRGIETANEKVEAYPLASLSRAEVQQSNLVFAHVAWNLAKVEVSKIRERDLTLQPIVDGSRLTNEDAYDIFALFDIDGEPNGIPYLAYHTPTIDQYRVAAATDSVSSMRSYPDRDEFTYDIIIHSEPYSDLRGSTAFLSFMYRGVFCLLDLTHSKLILDRVHRDAEASLTAGIIDKLPFLRISDQSHRRISARIISPVAGSIAYHVLFFDAMLNQSDYIGFKEEGDPQLLKPTKSFYLSPIPRVINPLTDQYATMRDMYVVMSNRTAANTELVTLDDTSSPFELTRGTAYVEFMIYNITDNSILRFASAYLSHMVGRYHQIAAIQYAPFISEEFSLPLVLSSTETSSDAVYSRTSTVIRGIDLISHSYPDVFGHNYTRQCPHYPTVKQRLEAGDVEYHPGVSDAEKGGADEWLRYPPDGGVEFYFRCGIDEPELKYPGVRVSKLRNRARYPLLPCCFRTSQFRPDMRTEVAYRLGAVEASAVSEVDITVGAWGPLNYPPSFNKRLLMSSEKVLYRGRLGRIPQALLAIIDEDEEGERIVRLGLSETNMVHAAYLAMDTEYQKLSTASVAERLDYLRKSISKRLPHPSCLYQELSAAEASHESLMREEPILFSKWTTATHYRVIEEVLGINLYVFLRVAPRENVIESNRYYLEIPHTRSGAPHMRRHDLTRPSVVLYRVRRFEGEMPVDSGIELMIHSGQHSQFSGVWGTGATAKLAELYTRSAQVLSFGVSPINPSLYVACDGLNTADYAAALTSRGYAAISQLIDERGLCRSLTMKDLRRELEFSIVFPGTQPYNLPHDIILKTLNYEPDTRRIFGDSELTSPARDGVFYSPSDDSTRYIFVPLVRDDPTLPIDIPRTSYTPLSGLSAKAVGHNVHWRTAYTYLRVILFFFSFLYSFVEPRDPRTFMENYVTIDETRHRAHAREIYDFGSLKRVLSLREPTLREALAVIRRLAPSLLDDTGKKFLVTSQKIYQSLEYYIRTVHEQTAGMNISQIRKRRWDLARIIAPLREGGSSAFSLLSPSEVQDHVLNFGSARAVRMWFRGVRSGAASGSMIPTSDTLSVQTTVRSNTGVILFRHPTTNRVWLIPGMTDTLRNVAIVCYLWKTQHRIVELQSQVETAATIDKLAIHSGEQSRMTLMFRQKTVQSVSFRRTRSRLLDDEEDLSAVKHLLDSEDIAIYKYVFTRDSRIELLAEVRSDNVNPKRITIEVLRTGPRRYTPMLSP